VKVHVAALLAGTLFGAGLALSQMTNPAKVQNFLDVFGSFDPSLALVMGAALVVSATGFRIASRRSAPLCADRFSAPASGEIDAPLLLGAALFGVGWGLAGFCPGPALAASSQGLFEVLLFVVAMLAGVAVHRRLVSPQADVPPNTAT